MPTTTLSDGNCFLDPEEGNTLIARFNVFYGPCNSCIMLIVTDSHMAYGYVATRPLDLMWFSKLD